MPCFAAAIITFISQAQPLTLVHSFSLGYHKWVTPMSYTKLIDKRDVYDYVTARCKCTCAERNYRRERVDPKIVAFNESSDKGSNYLGCNTMVNRGQAPPSSLSKTRACILSPSLTPAVSVAIKPFCTDTQSRKSKKVKEKEWKCQ